MRCAVCECVGDLDLGEEFEDGALHGEFVEVGVEEGEDAFGGWAVGGGGHVERSGVVDGGKDGWKRA